MIYPYSHLKRADDVIKAFNRGELSPTDTVKILGK
jgi:hypothetical protein